LLQRRVRKATLDRAIVEASNSLGYFDVKKKQREVIVAFVEGKDVFVALPTGSGKSLCYAIMPVLFDILRTVDVGPIPHPSILLVISPLISLMQDQISAFQRKGLSATIVNEKSRIPDHVLKGEHQLVYLSPESILLNSDFRSVLMSYVYRENVIGIAVDEAHCIHEWSCFRQEYANIGYIRSLLKPEVKFMALT
jgi:superfamily II DNA helicase RecQ